MFVSEDRNIKLVEFFVNVNAPYIVTRNRRIRFEKTRYFGRAFNSSDGFVYTNTNVTISKNDTIYYWLLVFTYDGDIFPKMRLEYTHT